MWSNFLISLANFVQIFTILNSRKMGDIKSQNGQKIINRTVYIAATATDSFGSGVLFIKSHATGKNYYKFYTDSQRHGRMFTSYFDITHYANVLSRFQLYLKPYDQVVYLFDNFMALKNGELSRLKAQIEAKFGSKIEVELKLTTKEESDFMRAADHILNRQDNIAREYFKAAEEIMWYP